MSDALDRLRNRPRPTVPSRDASLMPSAPVTPPSTVSFDIVTSRYPDSQAAMSPDAPAARSSQPIAPEPQLVTKQSTMRLEQGLSDRLQAVCRDNGLSREVLIEALFEYGESHPEIMEAVLTVAKTKNEQRQQIANQKRAKSMMQKFG